MPLYEYLCDKCGSKFELIEKFSAEPKTVHPGECGGPVHRLISAPALQFKGSGWYITDYAKSGSSSTGTESRKAGEAKESKSSSPPDTKTNTPTTPSTPATTSTPASSPSSGSSDSGGSKT